MNHKQDYPSQLFSREGFLMTLFNKVINEYKTLFEQTRHNKPLKIIEILHLSSIPGETKFIIQITYKNCVAHLTAAEIINENYELSDFSSFHAEMIRQAAQGKLVEFLKLTEKNPVYRIVSKRFNAKIQQFIFTIETKDNIRFATTAEELSKNQELLANIGVQDIYDIAYTQGTESILKEKAALLLAKQKL